MLLKVESYHGRLVDTLYPCLATSQQDGILVSGGRKAGDLTFLQDKSVSRQHFVLRCVGTHKGMTKPRTKEEKEACKESEWKMCIVLESVGKAGSFICSPSPETVKENRKEEYDDDSETDDEGVSQQHSAHSRPNTLATSNTGAGELPSPSPTTLKHFGGVPVTLQRLDVGETAVLPLEASGKPIVIQLGRFESTIKVSWIPMRVLFSNMKKSDWEQTILPKLHTIGGISVDDTGNPTHLVTEELNAGGKQIIAWQKELPMVQSSYLEKMLERKSPSDPLVNPKDHPVANNADPKINFWNKKPNRKLLQDFTFLSVEPGSFETMAVDAGAQLVALHEFASEDKQLELAKEALEKKAVFIAKTRRRITNKLAELGIPQVELKRLAKSVCSRKDLPQDIEGNTLSPNTNNESAGGSTSGRSTRASKRTTSQKTAKVTRADEEEEEEEHTPTTTPYETQCLLDPAHQMMDVDDEGEKNTEPEGDKLERVPEQSMETEPSMLTEPSGLEEPEPVDESPPKPTKKIIAKQPSAVDESCKLQKANADGWLSAAPQDDSIRQKWKKTHRKYHRDEDYFDFDIPIETEVVPVMTDRTNNDSNWRVPPGRKRKGLKDFNNFRKNRIIKSDPSVVIRLSKVGSQRNNDDEPTTVDDQERELAEEQRIADELFRNEGGAGRKRRRRVM